MIGVIDLDRIEAAIDQRRDQLVALGHAGMRERRDAAGRVNRRRSPSAGLGPVRGTKAGRPVASHWSNASCTDATCPARTSSRASCGRPDRRSRARRGREQHALDVDRTC